MTPLRLLLCLLVFTSQLAARPDPDLKAAAKRYFSQPEALDVRITPGNRGLSYIARERGYDVLKLLDFESRSTRRGAPLDRSNVYDYYWIDQNGVLVFTQILGSPVAAYVTNYNLASFQDTAFTLVYDTLPDQKNVYIAKEGRTTDKFPDLYRVNAYTGSAIRIAENEKNTIAWFTDKDGIPRIRYFIDEYEHDRFDYRASETDEWNPIDINGHPIGVVFLEDKNEFILFIRRDGNHRFGAYTFDGNLNRYTGTVLEHPEFDVLFNRIILDPETEETFGFRYDLDRPVTHWLDDRFANAQKHIDALHPDTINNIEGFGSSENEYVYFRHSDHAPGDWRMYHLDTELDELLLDTGPKFASEEIVDLTPVSIPSESGVSLHAYLAKPQQPSDKAIIMLHGGPRARDFWGWDSEAQFFASLGYSVLKINYRGSEGFGTDYSPYSHFSSMQTSVEDAITGAEWLVAQGLASKGNIAIYGSSFGGHISLSAAAERPELFSCAIGYAGVYNWLDEIDAEFKEEPIYATLKKKTYYGDYDNERDKWLAASALSKAEQIDCPVLLIHGKSDTTVSSTQSRKMHKALKKAGKDSELKLINFNRHGLSQENNRTKFYTDLATFVESHAEN